MPVMDGYTATGQIRSLEDRELAEIPIIAMTANAFSEDIKAAEEAGMNGHIAKPVDVDLMTKTLAEVLGKKDAKRLY
jgi:CheY-like chemotaxis protein